MLLFLPGLICDARVFAPQLAAFPGARAVDGYGLADSLSAMARVALAFADREGAERFDLFGHSMGGRVALELFRLAPDRVRRLALSSTGVHSLGESEPEKRHALKAIGHEQGYEALVDDCRGLLQAAQVGAAAVRAGQIPHRFEPDGPVVVPGDGRQRRCATVAVVVLPHAPESSPHGTTLLSWFRDARIGAAYYEWPELR